MQAIADMIHRAESEGYQVRLTQDSSKNRYLNVRDGAGESATRVLLPVSHG